jgi:hypothetical protein
VTSRVSLGESIAMSSLVSVAEWSFCPWDADKGVASGSSVCWTVDADEAVKMEATEALYGADDGETLVWGPVGSVSDQTNEPHAWLSFDGNGPAEPVPAPHPSPRTEAFRHEGKPSGWPPRSRCRAR